MKIRFILYIVLWVFAMAQSHAQTKTENYIKTSEYRYPTTNPGSEGLFDFGFGISDSHRNIKVTYFDGLGRPKQEVIEAWSPAKKNLVTHIEYELNTGQTKQYLPYLKDFNGPPLFVDPNAPKADFRTDAKSQTLAFYNREAYENTENPYSETVFEASPLKRVLKQGAPGEDWKIGEGGHPVTYGYLFNYKEQVKNFEATATWNATTALYDISIVDKGYYAKHTLYYNSVTDENESSSDEFTNQEGQVVMKRSRDNILQIVQPFSGPIVGGFLDREPIGGTRFSTHYVYDQFGNLTYILPPLSGGKVDGTTLDQLCYQYKYDHKNRLVAKKLPGKEWEFMVYDKADRLIASGPVYSPFGDGAKGWIFSKYDAFGRVVYTGYYNGVAVTAAGRKSFQDQITAVAQQFEKRATASQIDGVSIPYTNVTYPKTGIKILSVHFYDDYSFPNAPTDFGAVEMQTVLTSAKGLETGSWTRVLTTASETKGELSYLLYDTKGRAVKAFLKNHLGGWTETSSKLNFRGLTTASTTKHQRLVSGTPLQVSETFKYDHAERLAYQTHKIGTDEVVVPFQNIYDELGRVKQKRVGGKLGFNLAVPNSIIIGPDSGKTPVESSFLQKVNYSYNIRGWLTGVNDVSNLQQLDQPKSLFAMKLSYNKLDNDTIKGVKKLFNGNIAEQTWRTAKADKTKRYGYAYDGFDRLKKATFQLPGTTQPISKAYNESLSYDSNGNILKLERFGKKQVNQGIELDDLTYTYEGNMLKKVVDATNNTDGFKQGTHTGDDYTYDTFGNLKTDKNKGITNIKYNHLNLPVEITFGNGKIEYIYSSGGAKVQKKVTQGTTVTTTDYLGGFQYTNNVLEFFPTPEGYYDARNSRYVYQYSDHLGNTRLSYSDINKNDIVEANEILSEADYYPFGLQHTENSIATTANKAAEKYQYNAKEFQDELNLNVFDYGARNYDAVIGRWFNVDPLAEDFPSFTPYHYVHNNPLNLIDPTGMAGEHIASTYVDSRGKVVEHKDDNDKNVYLVNDGWKPGDSKNGLPIVGKEKQGVNYAPGFTYQFNNNLELDYISEQDWKNRPKAQGNAESMDFSSPFFAWGPIISNSLKSITTNSGYLFGSVTVKTPINIPVQRYGNMNLNRADYWGLKIGTNKLVNRTVAAIRPEWNPLIQYTQGVIPRGTQVRMGVIGPQGLKYPGGSMQFMLNSKNVINQSSKLTP